MTIMWCEADKENTRKRKREFEQYTEVCRVDQESIKGGQILSEADVHYQPKIRHPIFPTWISTRISGSVCSPLMIV